MVAFFHVLLKGNEEGKEEESQSTYLCRCGGSSAVSGAHTQQVAVLVKGVIVLQHCYLHLKASQDCE